ncbi:MAG: DUF362 domain-containing protein [Ignavibacteriae bacterium]|nr:DUF362 domain-containing protein [Ignavibacteriota bacterium]
MNEFFQRFVKVCPKSGKIRKIILPKGYYKLLFPFVGLAALLWIAFRVIPKPSRVAYPCVKAATPIATSFVLWLIGITASFTAFSKMKTAFSNSSYFRTIIFLFVGGILAVFAISQDGIVSLADSKNKYVFKQAVLEPNQPMGVPVGIIPGRVVWVHNPDATNENFDPMEENHSYFHEENFNQSVVDQMLSQAIQNLTKSTSDSAAWEAIFKFHNNTRGKGEVGYQSGEKIFLKMNATSSWGGNYNDEDLTKVYKSWWGSVNRYYGLSESSPTFIKTILRQLVNVVKVPQENIYIGDPMKIIYKHIYDYLHSEFPNVHYLDHYGHTNLGRELAEKGTTPLIKYSDRGTVLVRDGSPVYEDALYKIYEDMEYMINMPQMKGHVRGGVTMFAKNHFGSHTRDGANHLHNGLMLPGETGLTARPGYGLYRVQVDLMGHEILGKKNLVYLMDALWGTDHELNPPAKWQMEPFNNDWTSSVFASLDPVAIESVGYDFVRTEFTKERYPTSYENVVDVIQMDGVSDYLRQAADSSNWPEGIMYDPENDGTIIGSLGVHEHWNNSIDKQYSKNLGIGNGIELVKISKPTNILEAPSLLNTEVIDNSIVNLSWQDNSTSEEGFIIERKENSQNANFIILDTVSANQTNYSDKTDKLVSSYYYRIKAYNSSENSNYTESVLVSNLIVVGIDEENIPGEFRLHQNYPNPFNPSTTITFSIKNNSNVNMIVYDAIGRLVKVLVDEKLSSGEYKIDWNGKNYLGETSVSGIYFYKIIVKSNNQNYSETKKMLLVK